MPRTPTRGSGATIGYLKKGYPKQRPKNRINRTHVVSAEISDSPEAPSPRPQKKCRISDSPEAPSPRSPILRFARDRLATSPATTALTRLLWLDITSNQGAQPLRQPHDGTVRRSGRPDVSHVSTLPSATGRSRGYRPLCCLTPAPRTTRREESGLGPCKPWNQRTYRSISPETPRQGL